MIGDRRPGYDGAGNRIEVSRDPEPGSGDDGATVTTTYDAASRPLSSSDGTTYSHDAAGNLTGIDGGATETTFAFDPFARLSKTSLTVAGAATITTTYDTDALGRTLTKTSAATAPPGPALTLSTGAFTYRGLTEALTKEASDAAGVTTTTSFGLGAADEALAAETEVAGEPATTSLLGLGPHHDLDYTTSEEGALSGSAAYDPWGMPTSDTAVAGSLGFQADPTDTTTGLVDMGARHYLPSLGRFLTQDPVSGDLTSPLTLNPYIYGGDDPVSSWDPTGMYPQGSAQGSRYADDGERKRIQTLGSVTATSRAERAALRIYGGRPSRSFWDSFPELVAPSLTRWITLSTLRYGYYDIILEGAARLEGKSLYGLTIDQSGPTFRIKLGSGTVVEDTEALKMLMRGRVAGSGNTAGWASAFATWGESIEPGAIRYSQRAGVSVGGASIHFTARGPLLTPAVTYNVRGVDTDEGSLSYMIRASFQRRLEPVRVPIWAPVGVGAAAALAYRYGPGLVGRSSGFRFPDPLRAR